MTVDQLHDAIGMLPADLVAETDQMRQRRKPAVRWQRYAAMAACCVLVLGCALLARQMTGEKEASQELADAAAPMQAAAPNKLPNTMTTGRAQPLPKGWCISAQETPGAGQDMAPKACLVESEAQLAQCRQEWGGYYGEQTLELAFQGYDEEWFSHQQLLLLPVDGSEDLGVSRIEQQQGQWTVFLSGAEGQRRWLVLVEAARGSVADIASVQLVFEPPQE